MRSLRGVRGVFISSLCLLAACSGSDGSDGARGTDGENGADGSNGQNGQNGADGSNGQNGQNGADGSNGQDGQNGSDGKNASIWFQAVEFPATDADKRKVIATPKARVNGVDQAIGFQTILRTGDKPGSSTHAFGQILDKDGSPIQGADGSVLSPSASMDFSSLLPVGTKLFEVTHFEDAPGAMYLTELNQDSTTGALSAVSTKSIDLSSVDGIWIPCAGTVTPWGAHLGSEEYPADGRAFEAATLPDSLGADTLGQLRYWGLDVYTKDSGTQMLSLTMNQVRQVYSPYFHGYALEVSVDAAGATTVEKHYSMGRAVGELGYVMPDQKTVYLTDDGTNVGTYLYIADTAGDLSAGTLYAMRWYQTGNQGAGSADLDWISLGHATDGEIDALVHAPNGGTKFSDMFETATPDGSFACAAGFKAIRVNGFAPECLKLKPGMEKAASRLETRRYAAYVGATLELRKQEGVAFDPDTSTLFLAISEVAKGMEDGSSDDAAGPNHIRLSKNACGAVYALDVGNDAVLGSAYVAHAIRGLVAGVPMTYDASSPYAGNGCSVNGIASPDNLTFLEGYRTLIIGEDTSLHQNDVVWSYDIANDKLTRIQTTPYGAETTSPYFYANINGFAYLKSVVQHPFGESDQSKLVDPLDARGYDGYIGPFPAMN